MVQYVTRLQTHNCDHNIAQHYTAVCRYLVRIHTAWRNAPQLLDKIRSLSAVSAVLLTAPNDGCWRGPPLPPERAHGAGGGRAQADRHLRGAGRQGHQVGG